MAKPTKLVVHPTKFSGEGEVNFGLENFERAANANSWTEKVKLKMHPNYKQVLKNTRQKGYIFQTIQQSIESAYK